MKNSHRISLAILLLLTLCWPCLAQAPSPTPSPLPTLPSTWLANLTAIISVVALLVNAVAAFFWGVKTIAAKNSQIESLKESHAAEIANLKSAQEGQQSYVTNLKDISERELRTSKESREALLRGKEGEIKTKEDLINALHAQIAELKDLKPSVWIDEHKRIKEEYEVLVKSMREKLDQANKEIETRKERIAELEKQGGTPSFEIEKLKAEIIQINTKSKDLERKAENAPGMSVFEIDIPPNLKWMWMEPLDETLPKVRPDWILTSEQLSPLRAWKELGGVESWNNVIKSDLSEFDKILTSGGDKPTDFKI